MEGVLTTSLRAAVLSQCGDSAEEIAHVISKFIEAHSEIIYKSGFGSSSSAVAPQLDSEGDPNMSAEDDIGMESYYSVSGSDDSSMSSGGVTGRRRGMSKLLRMNIRGGDQESNDKGQKNTDKRRREEDKNYPIMSTVRAVVLVLVAKLRVIRCPHTETLPSHLMRQWDSEYLSVLLYSVFREYPSISWNRLMCQLMDSDLNEVEPYDGSEGPVAALYAQSLELPHHIHDMLMETLSGGSRSSTATQSLMERLTPSSPQVSLAFRAPSSLLLSETCGGWTLLHYLAATSLPQLRSEKGAGVGDEKEHGIGAGVNRYRLIIQQLMTLGIRIGEPDFTGRTPLHVAAGSLNLDCVQALITLGASVACSTYSRTTYTSSGGGVRESLTPLDELLRALGKMNWARVCTGPQLAQAVVALSGADVKALWSVTSAESRKQRQEVAEGEEASGGLLGCVEGFERNPLTCIVRLGELPCVKALVGRSLLCPHGEWNLHLVRHLVMVAVKKGHAWAVEYLWESYSVALDAIKPLAGGQGAASGTTIQEWVSFWHACLAACILGRVGGQKDVLRFLLRRPQALRHALLRTSLLPQEQRISLASELDTRLSISFAPFLHLTILREDHCEEGEGVEDGDKDKDRDRDRKGRCSAGEILGLLLASGSVGVSHILGTWSPLPSTDSATGAARDINAQLTAYWLPSLYRYSSAPKSPSTSTAGSSAYQRRKKGAGAAAVEVVGLEPHSAVAAFCDVCPLSLAAFTGENGLMQALLAFLSLQPLGAYVDSGGSAEVLLGEDGEQHHFDTRGEGGAYTHQLSAQLLNSLAVSPVVACTLSCNAEGLRLLRTNMGTVAFARACNQPDASGVVAVAAIMQMLGRVKREVGLGRAANSHEGTLAGSQSHAAVRKHFRVMHSLASRGGTAATAASSDASISGHSLSLSNTNSLSLSSGDLELSLMHLDASFSVSLSSDGHSSSQGTPGAGTGVYHGKPFIEPEVWDPEGSALWALASSNAVLEVSSILLDNLTIGPVMFRRPSQRSSNVEATSHAAAAAATVSDSGSGSSAASGSFISTARVWRQRERGLRARIEQINRRLFTLVHTSRRGNPLEPYRELPALEVAEWIEHQMQRPAMLGGVNIGTGTSGARKPNLLHALSASLRHWQNLYGSLTASTFASSLRALRSLYRPAGASSRAMDKLMQALVLLLDPKSVHGDNDKGPGGASATTRGAGAGAGAGQQQRGKASRAAPPSVTTWKKARAVLSGPESCSRKAVNRSIGDTTTRMLSYGNPFVSPLVSGSRAEGNPHVKAGSHANDRILPYALYTRLRPLMSVLPPAFTEEHVSSTGGNDDASDEGKGRGQHVRDRVRVGRVLDCVNVLLAWVRAVHSDGEVVWGSPYNPDGGGGLRTVEISGSAGLSSGDGIGADVEHGDRSSGITTQDDLNPMTLLPRTRLGLLEAVTLTEGRTRLHQALAHLPSYMYDQKDEEAEDDEDEEDYYYEDLELGLLPLYTNSGSDPTPGSGDAAGDAIDSRAVVWTEDEEREGRSYDLKWIQAVKEASATALLSLLLTAQGPAMGEGHGLLRISRRAEAAAAVPVLLRSLTRLVKHAHSHGIYRASSPALPSPGTGEAIGSTPPAVNNDLNGRGLMTNYLYASTVLPPSAKVGLSSAAAARVAARAGTGVHAAELLGGASGVSSVFERVAVDLLRMMIRVSSAPVPVQHEIATTASEVTGQEGMLGLGTDVSNLAPVAITAQVPAHLLLSLVSQGLYSAATQLLDACAAHQLCLVHGDGSLVVGKPSPFAAPTPGGGDSAVESSSLLVEVDAFLVYGVPATTTTTTWEHYDAFSFAEASPLHLAVRDNSPHSLCFARRYLEVFVDAKLDVATLLPFLPDDPHSPTSGTSNATLELVLSRLGRLTAYQTTELNALYYVHGITDLGPRLHGVLTALHGGMLDDTTQRDTTHAGGTQESVPVAPGASLVNTTPGNTASRFGSSRYIPLALRYTESSGVEEDEEGGSGKRKGAFLAAPGDYELALSLHLAKALRKAVLLALADNAAVAARYWKIGMDEDEKSGEGSHVVGGAMRLSRPPKTPSKPSKGSASKPSKPPRKAPRASSTGAIPGPLANAGGQSRFVLQLESQGGAIVEIPQAAGPMQGLCVVPRHIWEGHEKGANKSMNGAVGLGGSGDAAVGRAQESARFEHVTSEELLLFKKQDGHGRGPLSKFYPRKRKPYHRGPIAASSTVLPPFSSDDILAGKRGRRKRNRGRNRADGPESDVGISLMDGSVVPWRLFHLSLYNLLRATPLPALATGVNDTGLGVLHTIGSDIAASESVSAAFSSALTSLPAINATRRLLRTLGGRPRVLSVTDTGLSPVFASLVGGGSSSGPDRFRLANLLLGEATRDAAAPVPVLAASEQPLMKVPLSISQQYARHSVIAVSQKAPMLLLEQARARRILAEREYIGLQVGGLSLATVTKPMDLLVLLMRETERVWSVLRKEDLTPLLKFSSALGEHETASGTGTGTDAAEAAQQGSGGESVVLDSLQRARRVLALLKVPFSTLEEGVNKEKDVAGAEEGDEKPGPYTHVLRSAAFDSVSPSSVRTKVSLGAAQQLKAELLGWFETRGVIREHYPHLGRHLSHGEGNGRENKHPNATEGTPDEVAMRRHQLKWNKFGKYGISLSFPALLEDCLALRQWLHLSFIDFGEAPAAMTNILNPAVHSATAGGQRASAAFHVTPNSSGSGTFTERLYSGAGAVSSSFRDNRSHHHRDGAGGADSSPGKRYQSFLESSFLGFDDLSRRVVNEGEQGHGSEGGPATPGRPLGLFSQASYSLMSQLVAETRQSVHGASSSHTSSAHASRPYAAYHASAQQKATQSLLSFLHKHRKHPHVVRAALRQAYIVLDLARMLYLCRSLITVTQTVPEWARYHVNDDGTSSLGLPMHEATTIAGSNNTRRHDDIGSGVDSEKATNINDARVFAHQTAMYRAAVVHPLDVIYRRLQSFKEYEAGMHELVQRAESAQRKIQQQQWRGEAKEGGPTPVVASAPSDRKDEEDQQPSSRAEALLAHARHVARDTMAATDKHLRMKLCDLLTVEDLALFLRLDETISPRYYDFKLRVWKGVKALAALKEDAPITAFLARLEHLIVSHAAHSPHPEGEGEGVTRVKTSVTSASLLALPLEPAFSSADGDHGLSARSGTASGVGPDAAKAARMSRGSGLRALLAFLRSFSLRDVLTIDISSEINNDSASAGGTRNSNGTAAGGMKSLGLDAVLFAATELSAFEKSTDSAAGGVGNGQREESAPLLSKVARKTDTPSTSKATRTKTTSHGITKTTSEKKGGEGEGESAGDAHGHSAGGVLFADLERGMMSGGSDRPSRKSTSAARAGHERSSDSQEAYSYQDMNMGLSAREKRLMHGITPTEEEVIDIEALIEAPPMILRDLLQKIETQAGARAPGAGPAASTPIKAGAATLGADGMLPVRTLAQNYTMRSALLDDLHAAYRTANVLSWLLQALAGVHSRQLFFEPLVRDWPALARQHNPLVVAPLAFAVPARQLPTVAGGAPQTSSAVQAHPGGGRHGPGWGLGNSVRLLQPLVARQGVYMQALSSLLRKAPPAGETASDSERRLALGSIRGVPLRLSTYSTLSSLAAHLLASSSFHPHTSSAEREAQGSHSAAPLDAAALRESLQSARYLLELGCDPASPDGVGRVALSVAAVAGRADMVAELLDYCSDRQLRSLFRGDAHAATNTSTNTNTKGAGASYGHRYLVWHVLMAASAPPCATSSRAGSNGGEAAQQSVRAEEEGNAAARGHEDVVKMLLSRGFPVDSPESESDEASPSEPIPVAAPPHPHLKTPESKESSGGRPRGAAADDVDTAPIRMVSCLQLAILKRLPRACMAICARMTGEAVSSSDPARTEQGFPSAALVTLWPQVRLHVVAEVLQATTPAADSTNAATTSALPADVSLRSVLPLHTVSGCQRHAAFMTQQLGCEEETGDNAAAHACRAFLLRDALLTLAATLVNTYAPCPIGRSARHGECPVWRAARASTGSLLEALQGTIPLPSAADSVPAAPSSGSPSPYPYTKGHSHGIDRMTPGKRLNEDKVRRRSSMDRALHASVEELQLLHEEWTDEGRYYEGKWSMFHFAVSSARADVTSMLFRRFHLYASRGDSGPKHRYPSPSQLSLLACFYDHPQAVMAVMLYASSYSKAVSAAAHVSGASRAITQLYLGEFLNHEGSFPQALSLTALSATDTETREGDAGAERDDEDEGGELFSKIARVTPLEVAVHYGSRAALKYLCEVGVPIPFRHLIKATLAGAVDEDNLVHLYTAYFTANKDLRNTEQVDIAPFSMHESPAAVMRRGLSSMFVAPEMARQRTLINAPLPPSFVNVAGRRNTGVAVASGAVSGKATVHAGETLLHLCARRGHASLTALLLEYGANVRIRDDRGHTPLHTSVSFGSARVTSVLASEQPRLTRAVQYLSICVRAHLLRKARLAASSEMAATLPSESIAADVTLRSQTKTTDKEAIAAAAAAATRQYEADSDISSQASSSAAAGPGDGTGAGAGAGLHYEPSLSSSSSSGAKEEEHKEEEHQAREHNL